MAHLSNRIWAQGEQSSGAESALIRAEFGISQPAVSQHLRALRETRCASVRAEGTRRLYAVDAQPLREVDVWLERSRGFWEQRLDALGTQPTRGRHERRRLNDEQARMGRATRATNDSGDGGAGDHPLLRAREMAWP
ncbi:ArsR/SmtB family transcription factor [Streptomyces sp. NPDC002577]